jgi:replicative DNA helicase
MSEARFQSAADLLDTWRDDVLSGKPPTLYAVGSGELARIEIGPGIVTLIGGAPEQGKTAFTMQWLADALTLTPSLNALVCNVEMSPSTPLDRQLARLADIDLTLIRHRRLTAEHSEAVERSMQALEALADRLAFVRPPFDLANVARSADAFDAGLILIDYIQRVSAPGEHGDRRGAVDATMSYLRQFADEGVAIIVVAALARSKDTKGRSSYGEGLSLANVRETSELEYGADDAFILTPADDAKREGEASSRVVLKHLKSRHGETKDITLTFDRKHQRFTPAEPTEPTKRADKGKLQAALKSLWDRSRPTRSPKDASGNSTRWAQLWTFGLSRLPFSDGVNNLTVFAGADSTVGILLPKL